MRAFLVLGCAGLVTAADPAAIRTWDGQGTWHAEVIGGAVPVGGSLALHLALTGTTSPVRLRVVVATTQGWQTGTSIIQGEGWRGVQFPLRALDAVDRHGNDQDDGVALTIDGPVAPGLCLTLSPPVVAAPATGPGLSDAELFQHLDLTSPTLAALRDSVALQDWTRARHLLAMHIRQRPMTWQFPPIADAAAVRAWADRVLAGDIRWIGLQRTFTGGTIDWLANHSLGTPQETHEWVWALNRHADLMTLAQAYRLTGDERYATAWVRHMRDWIRQAPPPAVPDERPGSAWRTLDSGLRMTGAWLTGFYAVMPSAALTDDDLLLILRSLWDHGHHLARAPYNPSNHVVFGMSGLLMIGAQFPEFSEAAAWRQHAGATLERLLIHGTLDDGGWYELSPGYGQWICDHLVNLWNNSERAHADSAFSPALRTRLQALAEWGVKIMAPNRTAPMLNDGVRLVHRRESAAALAARFPESALLQWLTDDLNGSTRPAPLPPSQFLGASGYQALRTDWSRSGSFVVMDTGPLGGWHGHQDALNVVAWFHGREFLFDNGGHKYDTSVWRRWAVTTAAHNTVLVDGLGQARSWDGDRDAGSHPPGQPPALVGHSADIDWASGWYTSGYAAEVEQRGHRSNTATALPAQHHRAVVLIKSAPQGPCAVVLDTLVPGNHDAHTYEARWHVKSQRWSTADNGRTTWTTDPGQPNLAIVSVAGATSFQADSGVRDPEPLGWWMEHQNAEPTPALTLRHAVTTTGTVHLLTALVPFTADPGTSPIVAITATAPDTWVVRRADLPPLTLRIAPTTDGRPGLRINDRELPPASTP